MSILIKGMEMPRGRGVYELRLYVDSDGTATVEGSYCLLEGEPFAAVSVPPHGRFADIDVMCEECRRVAEEYDGIYPDCTYCPVHLAPTIIPADPAEEGEA